MNAQNKRKRVQTDKTGALIDLVKLIEKTGRNMFEQDEILGQKQWGSYRNKMLDLYGIKLLRKL